MPPEERERTKVREMGTLSKGTHETWIKDRYEGGELAKE
jgi:hypothetical protein